MKKQTKQSRKTKRRKDRQKRVFQQANEMFKAWLRSPHGARAQALRSAALMTAFGTAFGRRGGV